MTVTSIKNLFETEPASAYSCISEAVFNLKGTKHVVPFRVFFDVNACCKFYSVLITEHTPLDVIGSILKERGEMLWEFIGGRSLVPSFRSGQVYLSMPKEGDSLRNVKVGVDGGTLRRLAELPNTGRVFVYSGFEVAPSLRHDIQKVSHGSDIVFRGPKYAAESDKTMTPLAFISHASADKDEIARPLAQRLNQLGIRVWFDEFSLSVGDSLRESIEKGLKECPYCILVLTPSFLTKSGWTKREYSTIFTREILEDKNIILPVWHDVSVSEVYEYSPILADKVALYWSKGLDETASSLRTEIVRNAGVPNAHPFAPN